MLTRVKRILLKDLIKRIEEAAVENKSWGSNIRTAYAISSVIKNHMEFVDVNRFNEFHRTKEIVSAFARYDALLSWLTAVKNVYQYMEQTNARNLREEDNSLVLTQSTTVRLTRFMAVEGTVLYSVEDYITTVHRTLEQIYNIYSGLPSVVQHALNVKFQNGYNTVLVLNELILEVMINVEQTH